MKTFITLLLVIAYGTGIAQCGFNNNVPTYFPVVTPQAQNGNAQLLGYPDVGTYVSMHVVKGLTYQIYTNRSNLNTQLRLDVYQESDQQLLISTFSNTGNPAGAEVYNVYLNWQSTVTGIVRININEVGSCVTTEPRGIPFTITLTGNNTQDAQTARGQSSFTGSSLAGTWTEHLYDEAALTNSNLPLFDSYIGYNTMTNQAQPASSTIYGFEQNFNSGGNPDSYPYGVKSAGAVETNLLTGTFSARYRTNMTLCGTYRFRLYCDDGARLFVNNVLVLDDWTDHGAEYTDWYTVTDYCGTFQFDIEYYENNGDNILWFEMEKLSALPDVASPVINKPAIPAQSVAGSGVSFLVPSLDGVVRPVAVDDKTPSGDLVITQTPVAGVVVNDPGVDVTVTVADLIGNTSSVVVRVTNPNFIVLPLRLVLFEVNNHGGELEFRWRTSAEKNVAHIELMKSDDGNTFTPVHRFSAKGQDLNDYDCRIPVPASVTYFKLRITDKDGSYAWSKVVSAGASAAASSFRFGIHQDGSNAWLLNQSDFTGRLMICIYTLNGQPVGRQQVSVTKNARVRLPLPATGSGMYILKMLSADGKWNQAMPVIKTAN